VQRLQKPAFTLVELLVVIGIIAILIAILLPTLSRARDQAATVTCAKTMQQLGVLFNQYALEFKGSMPYGRYRTEAVGASTRGLSSGQDNASNRATIVWWSAIRKYMKTGGTGNWDNGTGTQAERFMAAFSCSLGLNREGGCDFGGNPMVMPDGLWEGYGRYALAQWSPMVAAGDHVRIKKPAQVKQLAADCAIIWDATEIPSDYSTQYTCSFGVDGGRLAFGHLYPNLRFRDGPDSRDPEVGDHTFIQPGPNNDIGATEDSNYDDANIRWRHRKNTMANFLMGDWSVRTMRITTNYGTPNVQGEVVRRNIRPRKPQSFMFH
jgi:prepilin-type N-terminal cleavage/methylation domain-containing protein